MISMAIRDADGEQMEDEEIREMLLVHLFDAWKYPYKDADTTIHQDESVTIHLKLSKEDIEGLSQTW